MPKVSIIIPVFNTAKCLKKCLDSICSQTLKDIEIICVNDCSSDNSLEILKNYAQKDERVKVINFEKNKGVSIARNAGIDRAQGKYIGFVDSDDYVGLDFYEKLYDKAIETGADIVKGNLKEIAIAGKEKNYKYNKEIIDLKSKYTFVSSFSSAIYNLENIKNNGIKFLENYNFGEDVLFLNENVMAANRLIMVNDVYYYYYRRLESADSGDLSIDKIKSATYIYKRILNNLNSSEDIDEASYKIASFWFFRACVGLLFRNISNESKSIWSEAVCDMFKNIKYISNLENDIKENFLCFFHHLSSNDVIGLMKCVEKIDSYKQLRIANLRYNVMVSEKGQVKNA